LAANTTGTDNVAIGNNALVLNTMGSNNIALGAGAGGTLTTGSGNIYINANASTSAEANTIRIGSSQIACYLKGIFGSTSPAAATVLVNSDGLLGTINSSERFKHHIKDMNNMSSKIFDLRPVTFIYNNDITE